MQRLNHHENGLTLLEIMIAVAIIGLLALIAIPSYLEQRDQATIARVMSDIKHIEHTVLNYMSEKDSLTASASQDDVIRANNGAYIGLVSNY